MPSSTVAARRPVREPLIAALTMALLALSIVAMPSRATAAAPAPTGSLSLGTGLSGRVDPRTGEFAVSIPVATVHGLGDSGIAFSLSWQQARATAGVDRSGWGAGWSLSTSFVATNGQKRVYPAAGGSYLIDPTSKPSGLANYKLADLVFTQLSTAQTLRARPGAASVAYWYTLAYDDGRTDYFDVNGNQVARIDRFGNRTDLTWQSPVTGQWRPTAIVDAYGLATSFRYPTQNQVQVISPERSDGVIAVTTVDRSSANGTQTVKVTDPVGNVSSFDATAVKGASKPLLTTITAATGARTKVTYQQPAYEPALIAVNSVMITDAAGNQLSPAQTFSLDPVLPATGNPDLPLANNRHNFTGYPNHLPVNGNDTLFSSGDRGYYYSTGLTVGATTTVSTYDALQRLVQRTVGVIPPGSQLPTLAQTQTMTYPVGVTIPSQLPADWARTKTSALRTSARTSAAGLVSSPVRTSSVGTAYDDHGRVTSATDEAGAVTETTYGPYGLVQRQTTTGADGSRAQTDNTFTGTGSGIAIGTSTASVAQPGKDLSARQVVSYAYEPDGEIASRTVTWAPGAAPSGADARGGGPDTMVTTYSRTVAADARTVTLTTVEGAGTTGAQTDVSVVDTVLGQPVASYDSRNRRTTFGYDAIGRRTSMVTPGGLTTTTAYTSTQTTVTGPDGRIRRTTVDLLGRTTTVTDNVRNRAFTTDPGARVLSSTSYSSDGSSVTATDQAGRVSTTLVDAFGRTVKQTGPGGVTRLTTYDDGAAHASTTSVLPEGGTAAPSTTVTRFDDLGRTVGTDTTYAATAAGQRAGVQRAGAQQSRAGQLLALPEPESASAAFNGIGQPTTTTNGDLQLSTDRTGPGGIPVSATATPQQTDEFPGAPITATTVRSLAGDAVSRTLHQGEETSTAVAVTYDAAGEVAQTTDPKGRITTYTHDADGKPVTKTSPSGAVTTNTYDPVTGLLAKVSVSAPGKATRTVSYTRVPAGQPGAGQVKTVGDGTDTLTYGYDADGHQTSISYPDGTSTSTLYNDKGQVASTTDVTGAVTSFVYDPTDGTLTSATQKRGSAVLASVSYGYDPMGRVATTTRSNKTVTTNTYTADNRLAVQATTDAANTVIESHAYTYDAHGNVATRVDTLPPGSTVSSNGGRTWTTTYRYDAYDRLINSAVFPGTMDSAGNPPAPAATQTSYTVDLGGDVTATKITTRTSGIRPVVATTTTSNTIDESGRLTGQSVNGRSTSQTFDDDGRVLTSLTGLTTTYTADGAPQTVTAPDQSVVTYTRWPDGSLRFAATKAADGSTSTVRYHYAVDGALANDTTVDAGTASGTGTSASYLLTTGREARTLLTGTGPSGAVTGVPASPTTTGTGTGYYLRDRHNSVTALLDSGGAVTGSYAYTDYGAAARADGRRITVGTPDAGRTNPFGYAGAALQGPRTEAALNLIRYADRTYNPATGRFTSPDPVDAHNLYQGFLANPIVYSDLHGHDPIIDAVMDGLFAVIFVATAILAIVTGLAPVLGAVAAAGFGALAEVSGAVVANVVVGVLGVAANLTGAATSAALAIDDDRILATGKGYFDSDQRSMITLVNTAASVLAGGTGAIGGATASSVAALEEATTAAKASAVARSDAALLAAEGDGSFGFTELNATDEVVPPRDDTVPGVNDGGGGGQIQPQDQQRPNQVEPLGDPVDPAGQVQDNAVLVEGAPVPPAQPDPPVEVEPEITLTLPADHPLMRQTVVNGADQAEVQVRQHENQLERTVPPAVVGNNDAVITNQVRPVTVENEVGTGGDPLTRIANQNVLVVGAPQ